MPWDRTRLCVTELDESGRPGSVSVLTDDPPEAVFQPEWAEDGALWFVSDRESGWWNLYRHGGSSTRAITDDMAEFGLPWWGFNMRSWGLLGPDSALAARSSDGFWSLTRIDAGRLRTLDTDWSTIRHLHTDGRQAVMLAGRPDHPLAIVRIDPESGPVEVLATASEPPAKDWPLSRPEAVEFDTGEGDIAHALYYPPANPDCRGPDDERPPLLVQCHGGPTGATDSAFDPRIQFWTSRGFAVPPSLMPSPRVISWTRPAA
jgi:dipeptidyl aminopeptidase/acylaminoacyl peptidase